MPVPERHPRAGGDPALQRNPPSGGFLFGRSMERKSPQRCGLFRGRHPLGKRIAATDRITMNASKRLRHRVAKNMPLVGDVKILLPNEKSARKVRHLRPRRNFQSNPGPSNSHEIRLPHRCTDALAQARCGPARVRTARCAFARKRQAELLRQHPHRLILSHRGDRSPRSPEATRTPSGSSTRGRVRFGARTKESHESNAIASRSRSIRALLARGRETPRRRRDAPCLDASARAASGCDRTRIGAFDVMSEAPMRSIDDRSTAVRACMPVRCARHCRGVCRGSGDGVPRSDVSSVG